MMDCEIFPNDLAEWGISKTYGLLYEDPLKILPEYFSAWNKLAKSMAILVKHREMRTAVKEMPLLDDTRLTGERELRLAHLQLSYIASGYVWQDGDQGVERILPRQVAVPLYNVSEKLHCRPALNHASFVLANWTKLDKTGENTAENLRPLYSLPGGEDADWFIAVAIATEAQAAPVWKAIPEVIKAVARRDEATVCDNLTLIANCFGDIQETLSQIYDKVSPKIMYEDVRPFLFGWGWKDSPLPDGLIYEGVSDLPIKAGVGGTSMIVRPVDCLLGVEDSKQSSNFIEQEAAHFPDGFRKYMDAIKTHSTLKQYIHENDSARLKDAYNATVAAIVAFRTYHMGIAMRYASQIALKDDTSKKFHSNATVSTSGKDIHPTLFALTEDTKKAFF